MALWFETESHFDIPDTNFTLPVTASGFNLPELNRSEDVIFFFPLLSLAIPFVL